MKAKKPTLKQVQAVYSGWISKVTARAAKAAPMIMLTFVSLTTREAPAQTFTTLYQFTGGRDGAVPFAPLVLDDLGNLYGTTYNGGDMHCDPYRGCGTVFKINTAGKETVLHRFHGSDGGYPSAGLVQDSRGNLYGTAGNVFKLDATGKVTVLYHFTGGRDGNEPGELVRDAAGNLYGTTVVGGDLSCHVYRYNGCGVVFKVNPDGKFTVLHRFHGTDGADPSGGLILDPEGNLYGTTTGGTSKRGDTASNCGTVFKLDKAGKLTVLHRFGPFGWDGCFVLGSLIRDAEGNLYGNTRMGGGVPFSGGAIFKIDKTGKETILYSFTGGADGAWPVGSLIRDAAGNFYGTTSRGGDLACQAGQEFGCGTIFKLDTNGTHTVLHAFGRGPGKFPHAGLVMDGFGTLYGTTSGNQTTNFGTVFKLVP